VVAFLLVGAKGGCTEVCYEAQNPFLVTKAKCSYIKILTL
jgi:hypothetical protein